MAEEREYTSRRDLGYTDNPDEDKCEDCFHFHHAARVCKLMPGDDDHVQSTGGCKQGFKAGKKVLYDYRRRIVLNKW